MNQPSHIAIIMDGNGRWAKARGWKRTKGHEAGAEVVREITEYTAAHPEVNYLTLYAFSTENWKRPKVEIDYLMRLLEQYLEKEEATFLNNDIRFIAIGDRTKFSNALQDRINHLENVTNRGTALTYALALNYGAHDEIIRSIKRLIDKNEPVTQEHIEENLDLNVPVDILIRTGGDHRISNFLLWQLAYAELFFCDTLWPDFTVPEIEDIIIKFKSIERRFGGIK